MLPMVEVRIHCRGGQGGVTAARIIGLAAILEGKHAIAFPSFTVERRGAPIMAFVRIGDSQILDRSMVYSPDYVLIFDRSLLQNPVVTMGARKETIFLANATSGEAKNLGARRIAVVNALRIALDVLGVPIVNTAMCGAFAAVSRLFTLESLKRAIAEFLPSRIVEANVKAAAKAYEEVEVL